jgi:hypothetical protein
MALDTLAVVTDGYLSSATAAAIQYVLVDELDLEIQQTGLTMTIDDGAIGLDLVDMAIDLEVTETGIVLELIDNAIDLEVKCL